MKASLLSLAAFGLSALAAPSSAPDKRQINLPVGNAANDANGPCQDVMVIFARGTFEVGNMGNVVGGGFANSVRARLAPKSVGIQGVDYPADVAGYLLGGSLDGAGNMADYANHVAAKCPNTKLVLSGYSQGGQVTHLALQRMSSDAKSRVAAIVIFGDPMNGEPFQGIDGSKVKVICDLTDLICAHTPLILPSHLGYGLAADQGADFVKSKFQ